MTQNSQQDSFWRDEIAERVSAHRARRNEIASDLAPVRTQVATKRRVDAREMAERAAENVRRRLEERLALEEAARREAEERERFFAEFNRAVVPAEPLPGPTPRALPSNVIQFPAHVAANAPAAAAAAPAPAPLPKIEVPKPDQLTIFEALELEEEPTQQTRRFHPPALRLDENLEPHVEEDRVKPEAQFELPLKVASMQVRIVAGCIDWALVGAAAAAFGGVFFETQHPEFSNAKIAAGVGAMTMASLWLIYQLLFLTYAGATPGMKVMKLGVSDFEDHYASTRSRIYRLIALFITLISCGIGFGWAWLDEDRLAWHDRMTRTYPRPLA